MLEVQESPGPQTNIKQVLKLLPLPPPKKKQEEKTHITHVLKQKRSNPWRQLSSIKSSSPDLESNAIFVSEPSECPAGGPAAV